jgi:flagellar protein FliT
MNEDSMSLEQGPNTPRIAESLESPLIAHYKAIADASQVMLIAARADDWDEVGRQEERCRELIARLGTAVDSRALPPPDNGRRIALLRSILADDAEIRDRSEPWLKEVERLLVIRGRAAS